jgi:hypothetical protein
VTESALAKESESGVGWATAWERGLAWASVEE